MILGGITMEMRKDTYNTAGKKPYKKKQTVICDRSGEIKSDDRDKIEKLYRKLYGWGDKDNRRNYERLKRILDLVICSVAFIILIPIFIVIAVCIRLDSKGDVIYSQYRVGKGGKLFKMYKFRSMYVETDKEKQKLINKNEMDGPVFKMKQDPRVTKVGKVIRATSLDELPQIINVIKGDMSLVGPRPCLEQEAVNYKAKYLKRLSVEQGLTCYWQISGRSDLSFEQWMELDLKYIRERSLLVDLKILFLTIPAVLSQKGAY